MIKNYKIQMTRNYHKLQMIRPIDIISVYIILKDLKIQTFCPGELICNRSKNGRKGEKSTLGIA